MEEWEIDTKFQMEYLKVSFQISNRNYGDDNITDPRDVGCKGPDRIKLAHDQIQRRDFVSIDEC
jgi:hypothetical protein